jgi:p21-activated kinase 1
MLGELLVMKELHHPNLTCFLEAYFIEKERKTLWIVMDFVNGGTLTDIVTQTVLRESQLAAITYEILQGISFLHSKKIIHRDIKV